MKPRKPRQFGPVLPLVALSGAVLVSCGQPVSQASEMVLQEGWVIRESSAVDGTGEDLTGTTGDFSDWYSASVPTTVLAALVENGVYQNVYFGRNLESIPSERFEQSWWYRRAFHISDPQSFENARLILEGVNYSANVWLNGKQIASRDEIVGAFRIFDIDITPWIRPQANVLALEVFPPRPGDFTIGFVDWNPRPPDANMGLWRPVKLKLTGAVSVDHPFVQTSVDLETLDRASLTVTAPLANRTDREVSAVLRATIEDTVLSQEFRLDPREHRELVFSPEEFSALTLDRPRLWWPNNLGEPNLYTLKLEVLTDRFVCDQQTVRFGIRDVSDYINEEGHRGYRVNGKRVLLRGAGWVDDLLLADSEKKIEAQMRYARHMNLNTVRLEGFWGSSQALYDLADQYGLLLMVGWSCQWEWEDYLGKPVDQFGGVKTPEEIELVSNSLRDQVLWLRNHPSILTWVFGSDVLPRPALEEDYKSALAQIDPSRPTLAACAYAVSEVSGPTGVKMNGPYDYVTPNYWYVDTEHGGAFGFNTETGPGPQPPPLESLRKMLPEENLWPIDDLWEYHCGRNEFNTLGRYLNALRNRYGEAKDVEEFARKAQAANFEAMRAMFEAFGVRKPDTTGVIQWMLNSAWPELYWQLFDWYLIPNGAFYGAKSGSEPLNIVYNYGDRGIYLVNDTLNACEGLRAEVRVLNLDSTQILSETMSVGIAENSSKKILELPALEGLTRVYFIDLRLADSGGQRRGGNFYWLSTKPDVLDFENTLWFVTPNKSFADLTPLNELPPADLRVKDSWELGEEEWVVTVTLENLTDRIAFFVDLKIVGDASGELVVPIFWSDNYVSLLPRETRTLSARFAAEDLSGERGELNVSGWNLRRVVD